MSTLQASTTTAAPRTRTPRSRSRSKYSGKQWLLGLSAWVLGIIFVSPLLLMVLNAFKTEADAFTVPPKLIFRPTLQSLTNVFDSGYLQSLINSVIVVGESTLLALILGVLAAFTLAFNKQRGDRNVVFWLLSTTFMPAVGVIVPLYVVYNKIGLLDTQTGLMLLYTAMNLPLVVLIMRSFYLDIPEEIIEAAKIDGAKMSQIFRYVVIPVSAPGIATAALLCFIFAWNEFFFAVMLTSTQAATLPVFIASSQTTQGLSLASTSAASLLATLPLVVVGWLAQNRLAEGFTMGAVK